MNKIGRFFIRVTAFLGKEIFAVLRQPMLVLTLVLGPFLILLLFGVGFRTDPRALRTLFVVSEGSGLAEQVEEYATSLGPQLVFMGVTSDPAEATERLLRNEIDLIAVIPSDAYELIRNSEPATFELRHDEIDPFQVDYINIFGQVYADEINRRILTAIIGRGQQESATSQEALQDVKENTSNLRQVMELGDAQSASQYRQALKSSVGDLALAVGATVGVVDSIQETLAPQERGNTEEILALLSDLKENVDQVEESEDAQNVTPAELGQVEEIEGELTELETLLEEFRGIDANVLVRPFRSQAVNIAATSLRPSDFFAPSVIALLLQHLAVTFGALSIVRERREGTMELFRVSPISALETLLGKYLSYLLLAGMLALILSLIVVFGLGVPMLGNWLDFSLSLLALVFTSLGMGFFISLRANTDTEAVQYSMIALLMTVFFSGAFVSLHNLWEPVRIVSWMLPATYGISLLQNIMLRGVQANFILLWGLTAFGLGFSWFHGFFCVA
jgi:ABC-2 type transport system permease protein